MQIEPYLMFDGRCEEAIEFYKKTLGAELEFMLRFSENLAQLYWDKHGIETVSLRIGSSRVMASDGNCKGAPKFEGVTLSISVANPPEADRVFAALGEGGKVTMPLMQTFFSPRFGMLADRFGVHWMVIVPQ